MFGKEAWLKRFCAAFRLLCVEHQATAFQSRDWTKRKKNTHSPNTKIFVFGKIKPNVLLLCLFVCCLSLSLFLSLEKFPLSGFCPFLFNFHIWMAPFASHQYRWMSLEFNISLYIYTATMETKKLNGKTCLWLSIRICVCIWMCMARLNIELICKQFE